MHDTPPPADKPDENFRFSDPVTESELENLGHDVRELRDAAKKMVDRSARERLKIVRTTSQSWGRYAGLGLQLAGAMAVFTLAGLWADGEFDTKPWFTVLGAFLGMGGGMYSVISAVARSSTAEKRERDRQKQENA